jgi:hypothetical protein
LYQQSHSEQRNLFFMVDGRFYLVGSETLI